MDPRLRGEGDRWDAWKTSRAQKRWAGRTIRITRTCNAAHTQLIRVMSPNKVISYPDSTHRAAFSRRASEWGISYFLCPLLTINPVFGAQQMRYKFLPPCGDGAIASKKEKCRDA
jgi:hypothetical protein